jgi:uncharacterized protein YacL
MSRVIRVAGAILGAVIFLQLADALVKVVEPFQRFRLPLLVEGVLLGLLLGSLLALWLWRVFEGAMGWVLAHLAGFSLRDVTLGAIGLGGGLLVGFLVGFPLSHIPIIGPFIWPAASLVGGYLGFQLFLQRR